MAIMATGKGQEVRTNEQKIKTDLLIRSLGRQGLKLVSLLGFAFLYLPIFILVIYSFNTSRFNAVWRGFTLDWYHNLLEGVSDGTASISDVLIWDAVNNSLLVAAISTILANTRLNQNPSINNEANGILCSRIKKCFQSV